MQGIIPKFVVSLSALGRAGRAGDGPGDFVQNGDNVDGQPAAFFRSAGLPFEEIEPPFSGPIYYDEVALAACIGCPLLPLAAFFFLGAKDQSAESGGKVAVGQMLGGSAGFSTASCTEYAYAGLRICDAETAAIPPIPQDGLGVKFGQIIAASLHGIKV